MIESYVRCECVSANVVTDAAVGPCSGRVRAYAKGLRAVDPDAVCCIHCNADLVSPHYLQQSLLYNAVAPASGAFLGEYRHHNSQIGWVSAKTQAYVPDHILHGLLTEDKLRNEYHEQQAHNCVWQKERANRVTDTLSPVSLTPPPRQSLALVTNDLERAIIAHASGPMFSCLSLSALSLRPRSISHEGEDSDDSDDSYSDETSASYVRSRYLSYLALSWSLALYYGSLALSWISRISLPNHHFHASKARSVEVLPAARVGHIVRVFASPASQSILSNAVSLSYFTPYRFVQTHIHKAVQVLDSGFCDPSIAQSFTFDAIICDVDQRDKSHTIAVTSDGYVHTWLPTDSETYSAKFSKLDFALDANISIDPFIRCARLPDDYSSMIISDNHLHIYDIRESASTTSIHCGQWMLGVNDLITAITSPSSSNPNVIPVSTSSHIHLLDRRYLGAPAVSWPHVQALSPPHWLEFARHCRDPYLCSHTQSSHDSLLYLEKFDDVIIDSSLSLDYSSMDEDAKPPSVSLDSSSRITVMPYTLPCYDRSNTYLDNNSNLFDVYNCMKHKTAVGELHQSLAGQLVYQVDSRGLFGSSEKRIRSIQQSQLGDLYYSDLLTCASPVYRKAPQMPPTVCSAYKRSSRMPTPRMALHHDPDTHLALSFGLPPIHLSGVDDDLLEAKEEATGDSIDAVVKIATTLTANQFPEEEQDLFRLDTDCLKLVMDYLSDGYPHSLYDIFLFLKTRDESHIELDRLRQYLLSKSVSLPSVKSLRDEIETINVGSSLGQDFSLPYIAREADKPFIQYKVATREKSRSRSMYDEDECRGTFSQEELLATQQFFVKNTQSKMRELAWSASVRFDSEVPQTEREEEEQLTQPLSQSGTPGDLIALLTPSQNALQHSQMHDNQRTESEQTAKNFYVVDIGQLQAQWHALTDTGEPSASTLNPNPNPTPAVPRWRSHSQAAAPITPGPRAALLRSLSQATPYVSAVPATPAPSARTQPATPAPTPRRALTSFFD